jgi:choline dehydrogenase-like flavoprotein
MMLIYDCLNDEIDVEKKYDFCIIGAGIAGLILADQLSHKFNIAIVESGGFSINKKSQELNDLIVSGYPIRKYHQSRIRQYGGTCNIWAGRSLILNSIDLQHREWIENSGWPISQSELHKYYDLLPKEYGLFDFNYFDKSKYDDFEDDLYKDIFSNSEFSSIKAGWSKNIPRFGKKTKIYKKLSKNKKITLFKGATVEKLCDSNGKVYKCRVLISKNRSFDIKAGNFILCTGGMENARILLSSKDQFHGGIGNLYDNVGRYYMDHPSYVRKNIKLKKKIYDSSMFLKFLKDGRLKNGVRFSESYQRNHKLSNNYIELTPQYPESYEKTFSSIVQVAKIVLKKDSPTEKKINIKDINLRKIPEIIYLLSPSEIMPHHVSRFYSQLKNLISRPINSENLVISHHLEQTPNRLSRVALSDKKNYLGINNLNLHWKINDIEIDTANLLEEKFIDRLKGLGWLDDNLKYKSISSFKDASHHIGTTRMAHNPKNGVVDDNCKVFSVENLYVAGSSVFPTSGSANPTYTIAALALRLANHLEESYG